jgi:hypothetical protein
MDVLSNGRLICKHRGDIAFPNDLGLGCSCLKCLEIALSPLFKEFAEYSGARLKVKAVLTIRCPTCDLLVKYAAGSPLGAP